MRHRLIGSAHKDEQLMPVKRAVCMSELFNDLSRELDLKRFVTRL